MFTIYIIEKTLTIKDSSGHFDVCLTINTNTHMKQRIFQTTQQLQHAQKHIAITQYKLNPHCIINNRTNYPNSK